MHACIQARRGSGSHTRTVGGPLAWRTGLRNAFRSNPAARHPIVRARVRLSSAPERFYRE
jgi:hypothetical protein